MTRLLHCHRSPGIHERPSSLHRPSIHQPSPRPLFPCRTDDTATLAVNSSCWRSRFSSCGTCACVNCTDAAKVPNAPRAPARVRDLTGIEALIQGKYGLASGLYICTVNSLQVKDWQGQINLTLIFEGVGWNHKNYTTHFLFWQIPGKSTWISQWISTQLSIRSSRELHITNLQNLPLIHNNVRMLTERRYLPALYFCVPDSFPSLPLNASLATSCLRRDNVGKYPRSTRLAHITQVIPSQKPICSFIKGDKIPMCMRCSPD